MDPRTQVLSGNDLQGSSRLVLVDLILDRTQLIFSFVDLPSSFLGWSLGPEHQQYQGQKETVTPDGEFLRIPSTPTLPPVPRPPSPNLTFTSTPTPCLLLSSTIPLILDSGVLSCRCRVSTHRPSPEEQDKDGGRNQVYVPISPTSVNHSRRVSILSWNLVVSGRDYTPGRGEKTTTEVGSGTSLGSSSSCTMGFVILPLGYSIR